MNYKDFKAVVALDANEPRDYEQIVFRTPDGTSYHNVKVEFTHWSSNGANVILVDLFNIKPKFKVGDVVTNHSGLYPNVKCTIVVVNEELQYYGYKEINGITPFKDQDKLKLVKIEPKFKIGDKVKKASLINPDKVFVISAINDDWQCYHFFNSDGLMVKYSDQDRLELVTDSKADSENTSQVRPPVEDDTKLASTIKLNPSIIPADELRTNCLIYDEYTLFVQEMMCTIKYAANQGQTKLHFVINERDVSVFKLGQEFTDAGYKVSAVIGNDKNSTIDIEW